jgi:hypothetical protein
MYHSPGLRDGVFFRAWSVPPYLPAIHNYKIASVPFSGLGINWGGWESCSSVGPARCRLPSANRGAIARTAFGLRLLEASILLRH